MNFLKYIFGHVCGKKIPLLSGKTILSYILPNIINLNILNNSYDNNKDSQLLMGSEPKFPELCPDCHGSGSLHDNTCGSCNGSGLI